VRRIAAVASCAALACGALGLTSCTRHVEPGEPGRATGPPEVRPAAVFALGAQLDRRFDPRPAGSQRELLTASYLVAHMAKVGYTVRLDSVPVANDVASANVQALPPGLGDHPSVVVTAAYDTPRSGSRTGATLGLWLELGRALLVAGVHDDELVALGADHAGVGEGQLGSRRLAKVLLDDGADPLIVTIGDIGRAPFFSARGYRAETLERIARRSGIEVRPGVIPGPSPRHPDVMAEAGFHHVTVAGGAAQVGRVLLDLLRRAGLRPAPG
jgi:hypothetical protein